MASTKSFVELPDRRRISYLLSGPDSKPIVLLSNSLCAPYHTWDHYVSILHGHNFRTLQYDQIGHGESTVNHATVDDTTFDTLMNDARSLLDALEIKKLFAWIGISMGAATGIYFTAHNPGRVERLVICDTISGSPNALGVQDLFGARVDAARKDASISNTVEQTIARWFSEEWREKNDAEVQRMRSVMSTTQVEGFAACCRALQNPNFDLRPLFGKIGGAVDDVMLVVGEIDANLPDTMSEMKEKIQAGFQSEGKDVTVKLTVINKSGHVPVVDGFDQYSSVVTEFLES